MLLCCGFFLLIKCYYFDLSDLIILLVILFNPTVIYSFTNTGKCSQLLKKGQLLLDTEQIEK